GQGRRGGEAARENDGRVGAGGGDSAGERGAGTGPTRHLQQGWHSWSGSATYGRIVRTGRFAEGCCARIATRALPPEGSDCVAEVAEKSSQRCTSMTQLTHIPAAPRSRDSRAPGARRSGCR